MLGRPQSFESTMKLIHNATMPLFTVCARLNTLLQQALSF